MTAIQERTLSSPRQIKPFSGTGFLLRFYLRLDRTRLIAWSAGFLILIYASVVALDQAYPTPEALQGRASLMGNPAAVLMTGPAFALDHYTFGAMLANELSLWTFLPAAIMSVLLVVRHTRADEEAGRLEVLLSLPLGRYAPATATALLAVISNALVALAVIAALFVSGQASIDSVAFGVATGLTGLVFAAITTVACQMTEHGRSATGMGMGALALATIVRGVGDAIQSQGSWLSWLSPIAWAQQTKLYVDLRWWPLGLSIIAIVAIFALGIRLNRARDLGEGLRPPKPGPAQADPKLLSPAGLMSRLYSRTFVAWTFGLAIFAIAFGTLATSLDTFVTDNPAISDWVAIDMNSLTQSFAGLILAYLAIGPLVLLVSALLGLRTEEQNGRVEGILVTGSSRPGLLAQWSLVAIIYAILTLVVLGAFAGVGVAIASGSWHWVWDLTAASLAYIPALLLTGSIALFLYSVRPAWTPLIWFLVFFIVLDLFLGELLKLPQWIRDFSPFTHTPLLPYAGLDIAPLAIMLGIAVALFTLSLVMFRRRGITNS